MASALETVLGITIQSKDETKPGVESAEGNISKLHQGVLKTTAAWSAMGAATSGAIGFLSESARTAAEAGASEERLKQAVENTGASWELAEPAITKRIEDGAKLAFTHDQMRTSLSMLLLETGNEEQALKRQKIAMDFARGAHIDLETASKLLGKVTDANVHVLGRYGIQVAKGATETEVMAAVQKKTAGQAEAYGNTTAGSIDRVHNSVEEFRVKVGESLGPWQGFIALMPAASAGFTMTGAAVGPLITGVKLLGETSVVTAAGQMVVRAATMAWTAVQWALNMALSANPIGLVIVAIAALAAGVIWAYQNVGWFRDAVNGAWGILQGFGGWLSSSLQPVLAAIGGAFERIGGAVHAISGGVGGALGALSSLHIPGFESGGTVPGPIGAPMLAMVHGGEHISPSGGGSTYNINVTAIAANPADVGQTVVRAIQEYERRGGKAWRQ